MFSAVLQQALTTLGPGATYRDLLGAASAGVRDKVMQQNPVGCAFPVEALDQPLFGGAVQLREHTITLEYYSNQWWVDTGTVHGIQPHRGDDTTVLAVLPPPDQATATPTQPLGQVHVVEVQLGQCRVAIVGDWQPDPAVRYPTVVVDLPIPTATVEVLADEPGPRLCGRCSPPHHTYEKGPWTQGSTETGSWSCRSPRASPRNS